MENNRNCVKTVFFAIRGYIEISLFENVRGNCFLVIWRYGLAKVFISVADVI